MLSENLQIYKDTYDLVRQMYRYMNNVPKHVRYGEYGHAVSMVLDALDLIYVANSDMDGRVGTLTRYLQLIGGIRSRVRLFGELQYLSVRQATILCTMMEKCSRQATSWRNSSQARTTEPRQGGRADIPRDEMELSPSCGQRPVK